MYDLVIIGAGPAGMASVLKCIENKLIRAGHMGKKGYFAAIEKRTLKNSAFRYVLYTSKYSQLVLMSLLPGEEIGAESHKTHSQFFRLEAGSGQVIFSDSNFFWA